MVDAAHRGYVALAGLRVHAHGQAALALFFQRVYARVVRVWSRGIVYGVARSDRLISMK